MTRMAPATHRTALREPTDEDYAKLLRSRDGLRRFLRWSEREAEAAGVTPAQHQLLLVVRAHGSPPTIGAVAEHLLLRHHSAVELTDRARPRGSSDARPIPTICEPCVCDSPRAAPAPSPRCRLSTSRSSGGWVATWAGSGKV